MKESLRVVNEKDVLLSFEFNIRLFKAAVTSERGDFVAGIYMDAEHGINAS